MNDMEELEEAQTTSETHEAVFESFLTTMSITIMCKGKQDVYQEIVNIGSWSVWSVKCPSCGERFEILNPDPLDTIEY